MRTLICSSVSAHQRHEPAAAVDLELTKNAVQVFLHRLQTQAAFVSNFLIAAPVANQPRQLLFPPGELDKMRQSSDFVLRVSATQVLELDQKMRPRHSGRADLLQTNGRAKMAPIWMVNRLGFETRRRKA